MTEKLPPHSNEAEQGVLGCIFLAPNESLTECVEKMKAGQESFYDLRHKALYEALLEMYDEKEAIDLITVQQRLRDKQQLEGVGGIAYIASLPDAVPSAANISYYIEILNECWIKRRVIQVASESIAKAYTAEGSAEELADTFHSQVAELGRVRGSVECRPMKTVMVDAITEVEFLHQNQGKLIGLATGYPDLDKKILGIKGGDYLVVAARPSAGKTTLMMNVIEKIAVEDGIPVGVFELEMTDVSLGKRMLSARSKVPSSKIQSGDLNEGDFQKLAVANGRISRAPIYISQSRGLTISKMKAQTRRMVQQHGIKAIAVDYVQLLQAGKKCSNRQEEVQYVSNHIKELAMDLQISAIVLAQMNREIEKDKNRAPRLSDLRECGAIEQDADQVLLLYRPNREDEEAQGAKIVQVTGVLDKVRNGETGRAYFTWFRDQFRFEQASKIDDRDVPRENSHF